MKLASIRYAGRDLVAAEIGPGELVSIEALLALPSTSARPSGAPQQKMRDLIRGGPALLAVLGEGLEVARAAKSVERIPAAAVRWHPPVRRPGKICAVAMNNSASNERKVSAPDHPAFFLKPSSCLVGHNEPIRIRSYYGSVHPEPELALVIGREVRDIPAARALEAVFGYTIFDDITGNGMRAEDRFHYYALYPKKGNPRRDRARRAALVVRRPLQGHRHVRRDGSMARDARRDRKSRRSRGALHGRRRGRGRGPHAVSTITRWPRS